MVVQKFGETTLGISVLLLLTSIAHAAPAALYGKSIKLSWTESRMERKMGESDFHGRSLGQYVNVYISSTGKLFNRYGAFAGRRSGKQNDEVSGNAGSNRGVTFRGNTLEFIQPFGGGVRHVVATFDSAFGSCTATAAYAAASGGGRQFLGHTAISGERLEVKSLSGSGASCSITDGNVFAQ